VHCCPGAVLLLGVAFDRRDPAIEGNRVVIYALIAHDLVACRQEYEGLDERTKLRPRSNLFSRQAFVNFFQPSFKLTDAAPVGDLPASMRCKFAAVWKRPLPLCSCKKCQQVSVLLSA
jgi:hypothetical protein